MFHTRIETFLEEMGVGVNFIDKYVKLKTPPKHKFSVNIKKVISKIKDYATTLNLDDEGEKEFINDKLEFLRREGYIKVSKDSEIRLIKENL